eukprot:365611-Chlamydomonas_euryale.AAC.11
MSAIFAWMRQREPFYPAHFIAALGNTSITAAISIYLLSAGFRFPKMECTHACCQQRRACGTLPRQFRRGNCTSAWLSENHQPHCTATTIARCLLCPRQCATARAHVTMHMCAAEPRS